MFLIDKEESSYGISPEPDNPEEKSMLIIGKALAQLVGIRIGIIVIDSNDEANKGIKIYFILQQVLLVQMILISLVLDYKVAGIKAQQTEYKADQVDQPELFQSTVPAIEVLQKVALLVYYIASTL